MRQSVMRAVLVFLAGAVVAAFMVALFWPWNTGPRPSLANVAISHMKKVGLAGLMYSYDHDERFPARMADSAQLEASLLAYTKGREVFVSPGPKRSRVRPNPALAAVSLNKIQDLVDTVFAQNPEVWSDNRRSTVYADSHAKNAKPDEASWGVKLKG